MRVGNDEGNHIRIVSARDGRELVRIPGEFTGHGGLSWSPDDSRIALHSHQEDHSSDVYVVTIADGAVRKITRR